MTFKANETLVIQSIDHYGIAPEPNTVVLKCSGNSGAQLIGAAIGPMYAIGVGGEDEGRGMFLTVDQATDLVDSLVQFIEEAE